MLEIRDTDHWFGGHKIVELAERFETPFFLFDAKTLRVNYEQFVRAFSSRYPNVRVYFSAKSNCELGVLALLRSYGCNVEIAGGHELAIVQRAGFLSSQVVVDKPYLSDGEIMACLKEQVHLIHADSFDQLKRVALVAQQLKAKARVGMRVNLGLRGILAGPAETCIGKFGVSPDETIRCIEFATRCPQLQVVGISTHIGSQIAEPGSFARAAAAMAMLAYKLQRRGIAVEEVNLGGGFPSPSLRRMTAAQFVLSRVGWRRDVRIPAIDSFADAIITAFRSKGNRLNPMPVLGFEPGRAIASTMGIAVTRVAVVKGRWAFLDTSHTSLPESLFFAERRIVPASGVDRPSVRTYDLAGATLNSADILATGLRLPALSVGDVMIVQDAGTYTISRASRFAHLNPPIYLIEEDGSIHLIRRAETYEDILGPMQA